MMIILFLLIGFLIYMSFNKREDTAQTSFRQHSASGSGDALEVAKIRLSRGEITVEEFEQIKNNLF